MSLPDPHTGDDRAAGLSLARTHHLRSGARPRRHGRWNRAPPPTQIDAFFAQYRSFILHYADLCEEAGGVDAFLIGSELVELTRVRSARGVYPAVAALADARGGCEARSRRGDEDLLCRRLDGIWRACSGGRRAALSARSAVGVVGDRFRRRRRLLAAVGLARRRRSSRCGRRRSSVYDLDYLAARVAVGRGLRLVLRRARRTRDAQTRTPITDALGKPWMFRAEGSRLLVVAMRMSSVSAARSSARRRRGCRSGKPIWIIETGCPAVDRGANAPNVFPDAHSTEGGLPYFSRGGRDDLMQARFIEAMLTHFDPTAPGGDARNPLSPVYGGRMVDPARIHVWCWDARPFPAFPGCSDVWADAAELGDGTLAERTSRRRAARSSRARRWRRRSRRAELVRRAAGDRSASSTAMCSTAPCRRARRSIRSRSLFGFDAVVSGGALRFVSRAAKSRAWRSARMISFRARTGRSSSCGARRRASCRMRSRCPFAIRRSTIARGACCRAGSRVIRRARSEAQTAVMTARANAQRLADIWLQDIWAGRETARFSVRPGLVDAGAGRCGLAGECRGARCFRSRDHRWRRARDRGARRGSERL